MNNEYKDTKYEDNNNNNESENNNNNIKNKVEYEIIKISNQLIASINSSILSKCITMYFSIKYRIEVNQETIIVVIYLLYKR